MRVAIQPGETMTFAILADTGHAYRTGPFFRDGDSESPTNLLQLAVGGTAGWSGLPDNPQFNPRAALLTVTFKTQCQNNNNVYLRRVLQQSGCNVE